MPYKTADELLRKLEEVPIGTRHRERRRGERFICYADPCKLREIDVPGQRLGRMVFNLRGTNLTRHHLVRSLDIRPVFANAYLHAQRYSYPERYYDPSELGPRKRQ